MPLVELLLNNTTTTPIDALVKELPGSDNAKAEIIENNLQHEIVKKCHQIKSTMVTIGNAPNSY
jgi:type I restriction enzyme R subunit